MAREIKRVVNVNDFNYEIFEKLDILKRGKGKFKEQIKYYDLVTAFDIETTNIDKYRQAIMYIWQFQIGDKITVIGRTWPEFKQFTDRISEILGEDAYLVVLVHNLSFEWQFLKSIIPVDDVFAMDDRKVLRFRSQRLEFRCTYLHSNMSLDRYLKAMNVPDKKVKGFDYAKKRYPWTELTPAEIKYCINDVKGLVEAYTTEMQRDGDNLYTIPLTSTGYSRRKAKEALRRFQRWIKLMLPDYEVFQALRKAFRGGDTHANRFNSCIIHDSEKTGLKIKSKDISSSYPATMMCCLFPGKFVKGDPDDLWLYLRHEQACLIHIAMSDIRLAVENWGSPYIPVAKCERLTGAEEDNGRVLSADYAEMYITELDFSILIKEYKFNYKVLEVWHARKQKLPQSFIDLLLKTYEDKTMLKGQDDYMYGKAKNLFNSYYGMMVQNPCKPNYIFKDGGLVINEEETMEDLISHYQEKGWLPYQWGVWVTARARFRLHQGLWCIPPEAFIYSDTDSIKYVGDHDDAFEKLNAELRKEEYSALDQKGKRHYCGIFEDDGEYKRFITMGSKKYCYEDDTGLHLTVSGVSKTKGAQELGTMERFKEGFTFRKAGGTESIYNDDPYPKHVKIQGHDLEITSNVAIYPSTYTLGVTMEYKRLILGLCNTDIKYSLHYER